MPLPLVPLIGLAAQAIPSIVGLFDRDAAKTVAEVGKIATDLFGTDDPAAVEAAIAKDPQLALQWKLALAGYEDKERQRQHEQILAAISDVANARNQTIELAKTGSAIAWGPVVISVIITFGYFIVLIVLFKREALAISDNLKDVMLFLLGALQIGFGQVCNYWLGSSAGSAKKDRILEKFSA